MKMRVVSLLMVLVMLAVTLTGCSTKSAEADKENPFDGRFKRYRAADAGFVIVDKGTGVCYLCFRLGGSTGLTVMLDEYGCPLTYWEDGWDE